MQLIKVFDVDISRIELYVKSECGFIQYKDELKKWGRAL